MRRTLSVTTAREDKERSTMTTHQTDHTTTDQHSDDERTQLVIEISPALRQRIERAAAHGDLSASAYVERLLEETVPEEEQVAATRQPVTTEYVERLREFQQAWVRNHPGVVLEDSVELIRRMREERTEHLERVIRGE